MTRNWNVFCFEWFNNYKRECIKPILVRKYCTCICHNCIFCIKISWIILNALRNEILRDFNRMIQNMRKQCIDTVPKFEQSRIVIAQSQSGCNWIQRSRRLHLTWNNKYWLDDCAWHCHYHKIIPKNPASTNCLVTSV